MALCTHVSRNALARQWHTVSVPGAQTRIRYLSTGDSNTMFFPLAAKSGLQLDDLPTLPDIGNKPTLGFIGLGQMGYRMAMNLYRKSENPMFIYDASQETEAKFIAENSVQSSEKPLTVAESPAALAERANVIVTMLPASPHVKEVYLGDKGLLQTVQPKSLFIDSSTIDPLVSRSVAEAVHNQDATYVDAPVSGGVMGAEAGTLTFMVGSKTPAVFDSARPYLEAMGKNFVHCGGNGNGQVAKICNNMLLGISMIGTAEAMNLGEKMGMDPKLLASILNTSSGRCWSSEINNPSPGVIPTAPASKNYDGGFGVGLMAKDMGLAVTAANESKASVSLGALSHQLYNLVLNTPGYEKKDFSAIFRWLQGHKL
ncbi:hypothetical protein IWQ61_000789 [Dispira simplex]|nr:hypothetical protein IWQ61_000789 [Dispira simplex]